MTTPALPDAYATSDELAAYWRPLTQAEQDRADVLLGYAANIINEKPGSATFIQTACHQVSLDMVKRAMLGGGGVSATTQSMADMSASLMFVNPVGNLYITDAELDRLGGYVPAGAFSLALLSNARVPLFPWTYQQSSQTDAGNQP